jgi:DMSO/TMAO reductase YedYZ heme-binding membrane subunit
LVYLIGILAALHFLWLAKGFRPDAFLYAGILVLLLGIRLFDALRRRLRRRAARVTRPVPA